MKTIIHIGANKTASTTLQRHLFAKHTLLHYVGEDGPTYHENKAIFSSLLWTDDLFWKQEEAQKYFSDEKKSAKGKTLIFSSEDIMTSHIASQCLRRLKSMLGSAKILLVLRSQIPAICSYYAGHGAFLRPAPFTHYKRFVPLEDWLKFYFEINEYGPLAGYDYWRFIEFCESLYGEGSVKPLLFEELVSNSDKFYHELSDFLEIETTETKGLLSGAHERVSKTSRSFQYEKWLSILSFNTPISKMDIGTSLFGEKFQKFLNGGPKAQINMSDEWERKLSNKYAVGNQKIQDKYKLPLSEYGYALKA